jgi:hypothetical protein
VVGGPGVKGGNRAQPLPFMPGLATGRLSLPRQGAKSVIKSVCNEYGLEVLRADEMSFPGTIIADVINQIIESNVVIAEITPDNPNVFYEVGYAHAINKPTILIASRDRKLPFDVSPFRTLFYENTISGKAKIEDNLKRFLESMSFNRNLVK